MKPLTGFYTHNFAGDQFSVDDLLAVTVLFDMDRGRSGILPLQRNNHQKPKQNRNKTHEIDTQHRHKHRPDGTRPDLAPARRAGEPVQCPHGTHDGRGCLTTPEDIGPEAGIRPAELTHRHEPEAPRHQPRQRCPGRPSPQTFGPGGRKRIPAIVHDGFRVGYGKKKQKRRPSPHTPYRRNKQKK